MIDDQPQIMRTTFAGDQLTFARTISVQQLRENEPEDKVHHINPDIGTFHLLMCYADVSIAVFYCTHYHFISNSMTSQYGGKLTNLTFLTNCHAVIFYAGARVKTLIIIGCRPVAQQPPPLAGEGDGTTRARQKRF